MEAPATCQSITSDSTFRWSDRIRQLPRTLLRDATTRERCFVLAAEAHGESRRTDIVTALDDTPETI